MVADAREHQQSHRQNEAYRLEVYRRRFIQEDILSWRSKRASVRSYYATIIALSVGFDSHFLLVLRTGVRDK